MPTNRFAAVQLTLLSVIVALILENLLNQLGNSDSNWSSALPWLQATLVAATVLSIWSGFALLLSTSTRQPAPIDFISPFALLITLTLAANSLGTTELVKFFGFLMLSGVVSIWALNAELRFLVQHKEPAMNGVRRAIYVQAADAALAGLMALVVLLASPPNAMLVIALMIAIAIQGAAAFGTMEGWRFVTQEERDEQA